MKTPRFAGGVFTALLLLSVLLTRAAEPLYDGLGDYRRQVTTASTDAARYFNQGLGFVHGFNHSAAIRSFQAAAELDPSCAMAHWGIALASGPHINFPMVPPPAAELAWKELTLAKKCAASASPVERALIEALAQRYANPQPEDRSPLDRAYADAMRKVWQQFPQDPDVGALFAESMMDLSPWNQWTPEGQAQPGTEEIVATLDAVLKLEPKHPFANHLYIHAVEASAHPERAAAAADRLRALQPGLAHNVHMPSHIDIRLGHWQQAIDTNLRAIAADAGFAKVAGAPQGMLLIYAAHNQDMLAYAAMMTGQGELAVAHIRAMVAGLPLEFIKETATLSEGLEAMPLEVLVRFGRWDAILAEPDNYPDYMTFTRAFHHAARAIAFAAKGDPKSARAEQAIFVERAKLVPKEETLHNNGAAPILELITHMVEGEILLREDKLDAGLTELRAAVKVDDGLKYDEPPAWLIPARHPLGAALMHAGRFAEAEQVYRADLTRLPDNGWSLYGLARSLREQHQKPDEVAELERRFHEIWSRADIQITSSCLCQPGR